MPEDLKAALDAVLTAQIDFLTAGGAADSANAVLTAAKAQAASATDALTAARLSKDSTIDALEKLLEALR
jgi:hypothetical protein